MCTIPFIGGFGRHNMTFFSTTARLEYCCPKYLFVTNVRCQHVRRKWRHSSTSGTSGVLSPKCFYCPRPRVLALPTYNISPLFTSSVLLWSRSGSRHQHISGNISRKSATFSSLARQCLQMSVASHYGRTRQILCCIGSTPFFPLLAPLWLLQEAERPNSKWSPSCWFVSSRNFPTPYFTYRQVDTKVARSNGSCWRYTILEVPVTAQKYQVLHKKISYTQRAKEDKKTNTPQNT